MRRSVVCFGDSNTFGTNPHGGRWDDATRWPRVLGSLLGDGWYVIEEGLGGRETVYDDPLEGERNGLTALPYVLKTHKPIDILIISLGTNDCKTMFHATSDVIGLGMEKLVKTVKHFPAWNAYYPMPKILIVSPILIGDDLDRCPFKEFDLHSREVCRGISSRYREVARKNGCAFFDAATVAGPSEADQLHMEAQGHRALAEALAPIVRGM